MTTIGKNCHITLSHPEVDSGTPFGFILKVDSKDLGPAVIVQREKNADGQLDIRVFFTIAISDSLVNPDGSKHLNSRQAVQQKLIQFLSKEGALNLCGPFGILPNVGASGHAATESHYGPLSFVSCQLINAGSFFEPADGEAYLTSCWGETSLWNHSYWR